MRRLAVIFLLLFLATGKAFAVSEFGTTYDTKYRILPTGLTEVEMRVGLKNRLSNIYADKFSLSVGFTNVSEVEVNDAVGRLIPKVETTANQTTIGFQFAGKTVGKDKVNNFSVVYKTLDVAVKNGAVWEVNIPPLEADKDIESQSVTLEVPSEMGEPAFITPKPSRMELTTEGREYLFDGQSLGNRPISAVFGKVQFVGFSLDFNLENLSPVKTEKEVALPPDTNYQKVYYQTITPMPEEVRKDEDGNWLAVFVLDAGKSLKVTAKGVAKLVFSPETEPQSADELRQYLVSTELWETENEQIRLLAEKLRTPEAIYDFVTDKLSYDYSKLETGPKRLGGVYALQNPLSAICTEFTDLFVTLARAAGIPSRELEGFAFTNNDKLRPLSLTRDVLHAWPEYYDFEKQQWIQIDPTWAVTTGGVDYFNKLDLNHFVFVVHGLDPVSPLPAGSYKTTTSNGKDVIVKPTAPVEFPKEKLRFELKQGALSNKVVLVVVNEGNVAASPSFRISSKPSDIIDYQTQLTSIPPFSKTEIELPINPELGVGVGKAIAIIAYDGQEMEYEFKFRREVPTLYKVAGLGGLGAGIATIALVSRGLYLSKRRKKTTVYW